MATIASGYSFYTIVSDGTTDTYPLNFALGELKRTYVRVYVDGEVAGGGAQIYRQIEDVPGETGMVRVLGGIVPAGGRVNFQRIVPKDMLIHRYNNGSILDYPSLDESHDQLMMAMHEVLDGIGLKNVFTDINMNGFKITNIYTDLDDPNSIATVGSLGPYRKDAADSATAAAASAVNAYGEYQNAKTERILAEAQRGLAQQAVSEAQQAASEAQASAADADTSEASALAAAAAALASATEAANKLQELINAGMPVPIGMMAPFPVNRQPSGWAVVMGQTLQRTVYPQAVAFLTGDDTTPSFTLPDLRGEFVRGADLGRGVDSGRVIGSPQGDAIRNIAGVVGGTFYLTNDAQTHPTDPFAAFATPSTQILGSNNGAARCVNFDASRVVPTANENRPRNVALVWCIKLANHPVDVTQADINSVLAALNTMAQAVNPNNGKYNNYRIISTPRQTFAAGVLSNIITTGTNSGDLHVTPNSGYLGWTIQESGTYRFDLHFPIAENGTVKGSAYIYLKRNRSGAVSDVETLLFGLPTNEYVWLYPYMCAVSKCQAGDIMYFAMQIEDTTASASAGNGYATITRIR